MVERPKLDIEKIGQVADLELDPEECKRVITEAIVWGSAAFKDGLIIRLDSIPILPTAK